MIYEPFIHLITGEISWLEPNGTVDVRWQSYASFEREKLRELEANAFIEVNSHGFALFFSNDYSQKCTSSSLTGYDWIDYSEDTYAGRILASAKFLKAVCEKEGVQYLPTVAEQVPKDGSDSVLDESARSCTVSGTIDGHGFKMGFDPAKPGSDRTSVNFHINVSPFHTLDEDERKEIAARIAKLLREAIGNWKEESTPKYERMAEEECDCCDDDCTCGCHNSPPGGCPGCDDECPKKIERYGNLSPLKKLVDKKLYYTKAEVDQKLEDLRSQMKGGIM